MPRQRFFFGLPRREPLDVSASTERLYCPLLQVRCGTLDEVANLINHFLIRPRACRFEAPVQAFGQVDA
jgi:hypothetical protein